MILNVKYPLYWWLYTVQVGLESSVLGVSYVSNP
jgi:hypothetical protein